MSKQDYKRLLNDWEQSKSNQYFSDWLSGLGFTENQVEDLMEFAWDEI